MNSGRRLWQWYTALDTVYYVFKVNAWVLIGTALGLGIFGIGPSLAAGSHMMRLRQQKESPAFVQTFLEAYRAAFVDGNVLVLPLLIVVASGVYALAKPAYHPNLAMTILFGISLALLLMALCTAIAMYEYYSLKRFDYLKKSILFVAYNPFVLVLPLGGLYLVYTATTYLPGLLPFFSIGIWLYINSALYARIFADNERRVKMRTQKQQL